MTLPAAVSSSGEVPSTSAPGRVLSAVVLVDPENLLMLSDIELQQEPGSELVLDGLAADAQEFMNSLEGLVESPAAFERALRLYLEQWLSPQGLPGIIVLVKALVLPQDLATHACRSGG